MLFNYRKGKTNKTISTDNEKVDIKVPRDESSTFEPKIVEKHERNISRIEDQILRNISRIEDQILFLYSKGMSTRDIQKQYIKCFIVI